MVWGYSKKIFDISSWLLVVYTQTNWYRRRQQCIDLTFSDTEADRFGNPAVWNHYCFNGTGMGGKALASTGPSTNGTITSAGISLMPSSSISSLLVVGAISLWLLMV